MRRQEGVALVLVMWIAMLMSLLAASYAFSVSTETRVMADIRARAESRALAQAAVHYIIGGMAQWLPDERPLTLDGAPYTWRFAGRDVVIRVTDAAGRVDLNLAAPLLLERALAYGGVPEQDLAPAVDRLKDWSDRDDLARLNGAESADYAAAGIEPGPKNASFEAVEELGQVLGVAPGAVARLRPLLTVQGTNGINPEFAPREVLLMLSGGDETLVDAMSSGDNPNQSSRLPADGYTSAETGVLHVDIEVPSPGDARHRFSAVIMPKGKPPLLQWRE
jgi:general secretion pathway protein K